jgi:hypothetical protein
VLNVDLASPWGPPSLKLGKGSKHCTREHCKARTGLAVELIPAGGIKHQHSSGGPQGPTLSLLADTFRPLRLGRWAGCSSPRGNGSERLDALLEVLLDQCRAHTAPVMLASRSCVVKPRNVLPQNRPPDGSAKPRRGKTGKPVQNAYVESFNIRLRDECLNADWFTSLSDARRKIEAWRADYNQYRPHSWLNYLPPAEFARTQAETLA